MDLWIALLRYVMTRESRDSSFSNKQKIFQAAIYAVSDEQKKKDVKKWLMEKTD